RQWVGCRLENRHRIGAESGGPHASAAAATGGRGHGYRQINHLRSKPLLQMPIAVHFDSYPAGASGNLFVIAKIEARGGGRDLGFAARDARAAVGLVVDNLTRR